MKLPIKIWCICSNGGCPISIRALPGFLCPECGDSKAKGKLIPHWQNHVYIMDEFPGVVSTVKSLYPQAGRYCTLHREWE